MDVLVLGGTSFVGRAVVERLLERGHTPTLFSRGRTGAELFPGVARRTGDREAGDYGALDGGAWDAVVDVTAYVPRHVQQAADAVGATARYVFVSTVSVYDVARAPRQGLDEGCPLLAPVRSTEQVGGDTYGGLKVACEQDVHARWGDRAAVVRPGVVAGPYDPTDRFTWWARRAARGGPLAVPGRLDQPVQVVDCGDLAALVVALAEDDRPVTLNATGPAEPVTLAGLVRACAAAAGTTVQPVTVAPEPAPLVLPDPASDPLFLCSAAAARQAGLPATPLERTAAGVLAWDRGRGEPPLSVGFGAEREAELLAAARG